MSIFHRINELITNYELFLRDYPEGEFREFGAWLSGQYTGEENRNSPATLTAEARKHQEFYKQMPPERQFLTLLSRASRFIDFYIRKALEDTPLHSQLEFQFLISIKEMGKPRKTDVIYFNLTEISTGVETLKRLQQRGLINDLTDPHDKRIRRLVLTSTGNAVVKDALTQFNTLDHLVKAFGTEEDWKGFITALLRFNELHNSFYQHHRQKRFHEFAHKIRNGNYEN